MANRNRRIGSNDRFFPLSKRGWGARGILRLAQPFFVKHHVGSNARSRVELLPHRSICCVEIGRRSLVSWITIRSVDLSVDRVPREEGRRKRYAPLFLQHSSTARANWANLYDADSLISTESNVECLEILTFELQFSALWIDSKVLKLKWNSLKSFRSKFSEIELNWRSLWWENSFCNSLK